MVSLLLAVALAGNGTATDYRSRYPLPNLEAPSGLGVNIHFTHPEPGEVEQIAEAGFKWIRMDFAWASIERQKAVYDFSDYDVLMASLKRNGIRPVFILDYGNDLYEKGSPRSNESREAFDRFVAASVGHFGGLGVLWEMWNEPNIFFWQPKPNVEEYISLAKSVGETIRQVAPAEYFVGPATSTFDWTFLQRCFDSGLLSYFDAVTVHPYRGSAPETVAEDWDRLRSMIASKPNIPLFAGEWGYSELYGGLSAQRQGWYIVREYLSNLASGAPLTIYYDWKDDGTSPTDAESHFGTVTVHREPKPAYTAVTSLTHALRGFKYDCRLELGDAREHLLVFRHGRSIRLVAWTEGESRSASLPIGDTDFRVFSPQDDGSAQPGSSAARFQVEPYPRVVAPLRDTPQLQALIKSAESQMRR